MTKMVFIKVLHLFLNNIGKPAICLLLLLSSCKKDKGEVLKPAEDDCNFPTPTGPTTEPLFNTRADLLQNVAYAKLNPEKLVELLCVSESECMFSFDLDTRKRKILDSNVLGPPSINHRN